MINLILLGPPGAGKGTQADILVRKRGLLQLSTGQMLRDAIAAGSDLGKRVKSIMDKGDLVPDDIVVGLISDRIDKPDAKNGVIFDGFPRNVPQAEALDKMLAGKGLKLDKVILIEVPDVELYRRVEKRVRETPPEKRRSDDTVETLKNRLGVYHAQTKALVPYYTKQGKIVHIDGLMSIDEVAAAVSRALDHKPGSGWLAALWRWLKRLFGGGK